MPDATNPPPPTTPADASVGATPPGPRRRKRRGWWWKVPLVLVGLLLLLVLLLPTILSTGPARRAVLNQVNSRFINGRVEANSWSLGWFSGLRLSGVRVFDVENKQVAQVGELSTEATLAQLARGNYALGKTTLDGLDADIRREADGRLNLEKLAKTDPIDPATTRPNGPADVRAGTSADPATTANEPVRLPGTLSGDISVTNARATITPGNGLPVVKIGSLNAGLQIPNINDPVDYSLTTSAIVGDGQEGKLSLTGTADAVDNDVLDTKTPTAKADLSLENLDAAALAAFLGPDGGINRLTGVFNGKLNLNLDKGTAADLAGRIAGANVSASGPALKGDTYATQALVLDVPPTALTMPNGLGDLAGARVRIGGEQDGQPLALTFDQGKVTVTGNASQDAGKVTAVANVDVGRLAQQLPQAFNLQEGVNLTGGTLASTNDVSFSGARAVVTSTTKLENVAGTNKGKAVALRPITITAGGTKAGQGELLQVLRDLSLNLASGFATIDVKGQSVGDIAGNVRGELAEVQRELGQFVDFGKTTLAGAFNVDLRGTGGVPSPTNPVAVVTTATVTNLQYAADGADPIRQPLVKLTAAGKLTPGDDAAKTPTKVDGATVALLTGSEQAPSLRLEAATAAELLAGGGFNVPKLDVTTLRIDLDRLRQEMPGVVPPGSGSPGGTIDAPFTASAKSDGTTTDVGVPSLKVTRNGKEAVADLTDTRVVFNNGLQSADVTVNVPDARSAYALAQAFQAPAPPPAAGEEPAAPMTITSGSLALKANVSKAPGGGTVLKVPTLAGQNIGLAQGDSAYQIGSLAGAIDTTTDASGNALRPKGQVTLGNLVVLSRGQPQVTENELVAAFDLALDSGKKDATINDLLVEAKSSGAVKVTAKGAVRDYAAARTFDNVVVTLGGDWAKLWPLVKPFVAADPESPLAEMKIAGPIDRQFHVTGSLPANVPFNQAIKSLRADGGLAIAQLQAYGLDVQNLDVPITLADGRATTASADGKLAAPAACNGGTIDLGGLVVDLTTNTHRLTVPPGKKILAGVALNGVLAKSLNSYGVPLFAESNTNAAKFDLTCVHCDALPVSDLSATEAEKAGQEHGTAEFKVSFTNVVLGGDVVAGLDEVIRATGNDTGIAGQLRGDVRDAKVTLAGGRVTVEDFTLQGGQKGRQLLSFAGGAGLGAKGRLNLAATLPPDLLEQVSGQLASVFPKGVNIPVGGRKGAVKVQGDKFAQEFVQQGAAGLIDRLVNKDRNRDRERERERDRGPATRDGGATTAPASTPPPAAKEKDDPLGTLIDAFTKDKDDEKKDGDRKKPSSSRRPSSSRKKSSDKDD